MQQRFRRLTVVLVATTLAGGGLILVACGTDNGATIATPQVDAGKDPGTTRDPVAPTDTDSGDAGAKAPVDCGIVPKLRETIAADGFRCGFYSADAGVDGAAPSKNCASTQTCCNPAIAVGGAFADARPPSFCADGKNGETVCAEQDVANGSDYQPGFNSNSWECADNANCPNATDICVMFTSKASTNNSPVNIGPDTRKPTCNAPRSFKQGGSRCKAGPTVAADEIRLCSLTDKGCPATTECTAFNANGRDLGYCKAN